VIDGSAGPHGPQRHDINGRKVIMMSRSLSALGACVVLAAALPGAVSAQPAGVEPRADAVLRSMTAYLSGLQKFSVTTENRRCPTTC